MQQGVQFAGVLNAGYELNYTINANNSQQISNIADASYRVDRGANGTYQLGKQAGDELSNKAEDYGYDANGNLIYVLKGTRKPDSTLVATNNRKLLWDEENRLLGINDNGFVSNYWYDAAGERTVKESFDNEGVQVNGAQSAARTGTSKFTAYISPYLVVSNGGNYTKHIYMGSQRITSKVSNSGIFTDTLPTNKKKALGKDFTAKFSAQTSKIKERFDTLGVSYKGVQQNGGLVSGNPVATASSYFYHSDHLGSSSIITDGTGAMVQHVEYVPFGETFLEERNGNWHTPYLFNGKERDEETGLHYYHARYYDSRTSVWLSVDPLAEKYFWTSSYVYCLNNPIKFTDPTGMGPKDRVRYARNMTGIAYSQETNSLLRTANTAEALKYMDCAEFVCRIMAKDGITKGVIHMGSSAIKSFLNDKTKFEHSDKAKVGDIALWEGHVGIVTGVDNEGKIKVIHARGKGKLSQENPYYITPKQYRDSKFHGAKHQITIIL